MKILFKSYQSILMRYPIGAQAVQTGLLMGTGDLIAQFFVEQKSLKNVNLIRTGQFTLIGAVFVGPSLRFWYGILEKYIGSKGKIAALKKVTADQLLFAPSFLAAIMGVVGVVQGKSVNELTERMKQDYPDILKNNYKLWPAVQLCNFYLVPLQYQVVTVQFIAILWNTYLSWKMNRSVPLSNQPQSLPGTVNDGPKALDMSSSSLNDNCQADSERLGFEHSASYLPNHPSSRLEIYQTFDYQLSAFEGYKGEFPPSSDGTGNQNSTDS